MVITKTFGPYDGNSTGYSFIYTIKQGSNSTSSQQQAAAEPEKQVHTEYDLIAEKSVDESVPLFKDILYVLFILNHRVFCRYQHDLLGITRAEKQPKGVLLCNDRGPKACSQK